MLCIIILRLSSAYVLHRADFRMREEEQEKDEKKRFPVECHSLITTELRLMSSDSTCAYVINNARALYCDGCISDR